MTEPRITIGFGPGELDRLAAAFSKAFKTMNHAVLNEPVKITPLVEPITITVPIQARKNKATPQATEDLCLFFDALNQEHWVTQAVGDTTNWRQAFFLPRS